tara:strand:+ start:15939 stop:16685 length:747 start_codon:yes stop_codon:yes gene_type:complete
MNKISFWNNKFNLTSLKNKITQPVSNIIKKNKKSLTLIKKNYMVIFTVILSIYLYNSRPVALLGLLSHSFSLVLMCGLIFYNIYSENIYIAIAQVLLFIIIILCKQTAETRKIFKNIENRERFAVDNENEDADEDEEEEPEEDKDEDDDEDDDGGDEDNSDEEPAEDKEDDEASDSDSDSEEDGEDEESEEDEDSSDEDSGDEDSDDEDSGTEGFMGSKSGKKTNLNDTFRNLHDAIHNLETFIDIDK